MSRTTPLLNRKGSVPVYIIWIILPYSGQLDYMTRKFSLGETQAYAIGRACGFSYICLTYMWLPMSRRILQICTRGWWFQPAKERKTIKKKSAKFYCRRSTNFVYTHIMTRSLTLEMPSMGLQVSIFYLVFYGRWEHLYSPAVRQVDIKLCIFLVAFGGVVW